MRSGPAGDRQEAAKNDVWEGVGDRRGVTSRGPRALTHVDSDLQPELERERPLPGAAGPKRAIPPDRASAGEAEAELELTDVVMVLTDVVELDHEGLAPVGFGERPPCLACGSVERPLWDGVCAWCGGDEGDLGV